MFADPADEGKRNQKPEEGQARHSLHDVGKPQHPPTESFAPGEKDAGRNSCHRRDRHGDRDKPHMFEGQFQQLTDQARRHQISPLTSRQDRKSRTSSPRARRNSEGVVRTSKRPCCTRPTRVARINASRTSCVTKIAVLPRFLRKARNWRCNSTRVMGSSAPNGSSNSNK